LFATQPQQDELAARYRAGGMGYGEAKTTLYEAAMDYFGDAFEKRADLEQRPDDVEDILQQGAKQARRKAREVLERVRTACGLKSLPDAL
jgi:tryptophanyl-tRNA synthetase